LATEVLTIITHRFIGRHADNGAFRTLCGVPLSFPNPYIPIYITWTNEPVYISKRTAVLSINSIKKTFMSLR
jgi:hypothetical protein